MKKRRIILAYRSLIIKLYCLVRFLIIRINILEKIEQPLNDYSAGRVLDVGCGFGLFAFYNATRHRDLTIDGVDINARRIAEAEEVRRRLGIENVRFEVRDVRQLESGGERYKVIYMLDILHHIPVLSKYRLLRTCNLLLDPDGILIIKDIHTASRHKLIFTWLLDKLVDFRAPLTYQHYDKIERILGFCGFKTVREDVIDDVLPYPHMILVCQKDQGYHSPLQRPQ